MLLAIAHLAVDACLVFARAIARPATPPLPRLRDLDPRTLWDIGVIRSTWPSRSRDSDRF